VRKTLSYFEITRPLNNLITAFAVFIGAWTSGWVSSFDRLILALVSASFISAGGYVINDFFDLSIDRINKPQRTLPRGEISPASALVFSLCLFLAGLLISIFIKPAAFLLALWATGLLVLYSYRLKRTPLFGNLLVSFVCGLAFVYGGVVGRDFRFSLIPAGFAFLFHLGREILKDIEDLAGDESVRAQTLPITWGMNISLLLITIVFSGLIFLTLVPYYLNVFAFSYLALVICVDLLLIYVMVSMWSNRSKENLGRLSQILKFNMILGLLAIFVVRL